MDLYAELQTVARALDAANISYALRGGLAGGAHGYVRATRDIDLLIQPADLDAVSENLSRVGYVHTGGTLPFRRPDGTIRKIHRLTKVDGSDHITVDLLLVGDAVLTEAWQTRLRLDLEDFTLSVVSRDGLVAMKRDSERAIDREDIERLLDHD